MNIVACRLSGCAFPHKEVTYRYKVEFESEGGYSPDLHFLVPVVIEKNVLPWGNENLQQSFFHVLADMIVFENEQDAILCYLRFS